MKIWRYVIFRTDKAPGLLQYLKTNDIAYEEDTLFNSLKIDESNPHWPAVCGYVSKEHLFCRTETTYEKQELASAEWLRMWSAWRNGYPQPDEDFGYQTTTYTRAYCCDHCDCGLKQTGLFSIKKKPNWGTHHFMELNWVGDELFVSDTAKGIIQQYGFSGVNFRPVTLKKDAAICDNVHQIEVLHVLKPGIIESDMHFKINADCPKCGRRKYVLGGRGPMVFKRSAFENAEDFMKTSEYFGAGHYAARMILVRNEVYQAITEKRLDRNLVFEPIQLI